MNEIPYSNELVVNRLHYYPSNIKQYIKRALLKQDASSLKLLGNKAFALKNFFSAINLFSYGIEKAVKSDDSQLLLILYGNRSQGYINTQQYEKAVVDSNKCLEIDPESLKNQFRKAKALSQLGKEQESLEILNNLNPNNNNEEILSFIKDVQERIKQQQGIFDFGKLLQESKQCKLKQDLKILDYYGPLELKLNKEQRSIFASQDIKKVSQYLQRSQSTIMNQDQ